MSVATADLEARAGRFQGEGHASGGSLAAILAAGVGLLALALVNLGTELSKSFSDAVFAVGKAWIPNAQGIGPYSGKETLFVLAWLGAWAVLHVALRHREPDVRLTFGVFLAMLGAATLLIWPPVWHLLGA